MKEHKYDSEKAYIYLKKENNIELASVLPLND